MGPPNADDVGFKPFDDTNEDYGDIGESQLMALCSGSFATQFPQKVSSIDTFNSILPSKCANQYACTFKQETAEQNADVQPAVVPENVPEKVAEKVAEDSSKTDAADQKVARPDFSSDEEDQELPENVEKKKKKKKKKGKKKKQAQLLVYSGKYSLFMSWNK